MCHINLWNKGWRKKPWQLICKCLFGLKSTDSFFKLRSLLNVCLFSICLHVVISCFLLDRSTLPDSETMLENDGYDAPDGQLIMSRLQWDGSSDISPSDSASSKASTNNSESKRPKKKKKPSTLTLTTTGGGGERDKGQERERGDRERAVGSGSGSSSSQNPQGLSIRKKRPKLPIPPIPSIYDDLNWGTGNIFTHRVCDHSFDEFLCDLRSPPFQGLWTRWDTSLLNVCKRENIWGPFQTFASGAQESAFVMAQCCTVKSECFCDFFFSF